MYELSIGKGVVQICCEHAHGVRVVRVTLEIGDETEVMPDALRHCFDICAEGTPLEGAELEIVPTQGDELLLRSMTMA